MPIKFRNTNKKYSLIAAIQSQCAKDFAQYKSGRRFKREASDKKAYKPGTLGLSMVSQAIQKEYGGYLNRSGRKLLAKAGRVSRPRFYNI
ncbi:MULTISPECIES: hypothetical protein [unclassified Paenibacillus]|uniref:hypothetical protein n=1 Tax=unclassified Paenibacillus TaxID=185978 RepID=UPI0024061411|nr:MULTISPECIES: hypothetical protein [unclassified Paenibacillus]MDF9845109.1 hypothetical protein [Paenibacillus sp. PastF-2]MDF9851708.1 hypothetical protein [Paenibacillus sp. PastM-2]MDF9858339.1 hypothetical protein [Paenibacillus sp. PastF-1]MDH6483581.1 hypothetical protein [Paenibacillus sp. PastH-2]MDH6511014.1 hypothetical protein [Paenibacillus sp. PastM-3]